MRLALAPGNSIRLAPVSSWRTSSFCEHFHIFLGSQDGPGLIFSLLQPWNQLFFPNSPGSFHCRMVFRNQIRVPGELITRVSLLLGSLSRQKRNICMYTNLHTHTRFFLQLSLYIKNYAILQITDFNPIPQGSS